MVVSRESGSAVARNPGKEWILELPVTIVSPLSVSDARATVIGSLVVGMLSARNLRPMNMRGWGWSKVDSISDQQTTVFRVTRAPGVGSIKGLEIRCSYAVHGSGSVVTVDWGPGGASGIMFGLGGVIQKEVALLQKQLGS